MLRLVASDDDFASLVLLKAFCDKVLSVGDLFDHGIFFPKTLTTWCDILIEITNK